MQVKGAVKHILEKLKVDLPEYLLYHSVSHVRDVKVQAMRIAASEGITNQEDLDLLETAAIYHDCGFLSTYTNHEEKGCEIARELLPDFDYTPAQIEIIEGFINDQSTDSSLPIEIKSLPIKTLTSPPIVNKPSARGCCFASISLTKLIVSPELTTKPNINLKTLGFGVSAVLINIVILLNTC